jgi:hypothetical protein
LVGAWSGRATASATGGSAESNTKVDLEGVEKPDESDLRCAGAEAKPAV